MWDDDFLKINVILKSELRKKNEIRVKLLSLISLSRHFVKKIAVVV